LKFKDENRPHRKVGIIDIEAGYNSVVALSDDLEVFVWGRRMGVYP
jgi:alpha-tubulin suppressor-like RCC1 family protein